MGRCPLKDSRWVWGPSSRFGPGRKTFMEVQDWSGNTRGGPGRVGRQSGRSGTGRGTFREVRDESMNIPQVREGSGDTQIGL